MNAHNPAALIDATAMDDAGKVRCLMSDNSEAKGHYLQRSEAEPPNSMPDKGDFPAEILRACHALSRIARQRRWQVILGTDRTPGREVYTLELRARQPGDDDDA